MTTVYVETTVGTFGIELYESRAPHTCWYFRTLVEQDQLRGAQAFRLLNERNQQDQAAPIHVLQFGHEDWMTTRKHRVPHEHTGLTGLVHKRWSVSAARFGQAELYGSFFVCMRDEPALDHGGDRHDDGEGFAVFGVVCSGYQVLEHIYAAPVFGERLDPPIAVTGFSTVSEGDR